jgi:cytochrome P450
MSEMEDEVRRIVSGYVDAVVELGEADLVADITSPFPMDVISAVLGISERTVRSCVGCPTRVLVREDGSMQMPREALEGMFEMLEYFQDDLDRRRTTGDEGLSSDLIALEVDGRRSPRRSCSVSACCW